MAVCDIYSADRAVYIADRAIYNADTPVYSAVCAVYSADRAVYIALLVYSADRVAINVFHLDARPHQFSNVVAAEHDHGWSVGKDR